MTDLSQAAKQFHSAKEAEWKSLVTIACGIKPGLNERATKRLAEGTKIGAKTLRRKMGAIQLARISGLSIEQIVEAGQEKILRQFVTTKVKERTLPLVPFPHKLTVPVRDAFDASCRRVAKVLGLKTWDEVVDWINAQIELATDEEILHGAGEVTHPREAKPKVIPPLIHGFNCEKMPHTNGGYMHDENDDKPFDVDGVMYCGRCHIWLSR